MYADLTWLKLRRLAAWSLTCPMHGFDLLALARGVGGGAVAKLPVLVLPMAALLLVVLPVVPVPVVVLPVEVLPVVVLPMVVLPVVVLPERNGFGL